MKAKFKVIVSFEAEIEGNSDWYPSNPTTLKELGKEIETQLKSVDGQDILVDLLIKSKAKVEIKPR